VQSSARTVQRSQQESKSAGSQGIYSLVASLFGFFTGFVLALAVFFNVAQLA
jgi:hypothetical protein